MHYEFLQTDDGTKIKENAIKFLHFLLDNKIYIREMNIETLDFIPCHGPFFSFVCNAAISLIGCEQNCKRRRLVFPITVITWRPSSLHQSNYSHCYEVFMSCTKTEAHLSDSDKIGQ